MNLKDHKVILFKNDYKTEGSKQPDFKGSVFHKDNDEKMLDAAGWANKSKGGAKYISISFSDVYKKPDQTTTTTTTKEEDDFDDDLPF